MAGKTLFSRRTLSLLVFACVAIIAYISLPNEEVEAEKVLPPLPRLPSLPVEQWKTANNMPIWFLSTPSQSLRINIRINAGSIQDGQYPGLAWLTLATLQQKLKHIQMPSLLDGRFYVNIAYALSLDPDSLLQQLKKLASSIKHPFNRLECAAGQRLLQKWQTQLPPQDLQLANLRFEQYAASHDPLSNPFRWNCDHVNKFKQQLYNQANSQILIAGQIGQQEAQLISNKLTRAFPPGESVTSQAPRPKLDNQKFTLKHLTQHQLSWMFDHTETEDLLAWQLFIHLLPADLGIQHWQSLPWGALQLQLNQQELELVIPALTVTLAALNQATEEQLHQGKRLLLQRLGQQLSSIDGKMSYLQDAIYTQGSFSPEEDFIDLQLKDLRAAIKRLQRSPVILQSPIEAVEEPKPKNPQDPPNGQTQDTESA